MAEKEPGVSSDPEELSAEEIVALEEGLRAQREENNRRLNLEIAEKMGDPEIPKYIDKITESIGSSIKIRILELSEKDPKKAQECMELFAEFSDYLYKRAGSENLSDNRSRNRIEKALEGASEILKP